MKRSSTKTLIKAMQILSKDIQSEDQVANAAISEAADRLQELRKYKNFYDFVSFLIAERREECTGKAFYDAVKQQWQKYQRKGR